MNTENTINPRELCSRKLWQLISDADDAAISKAELDDAIAELAQRRRYLAELRQLGKLTETH